MPTSGLVLGCAGMAELALALQRDYGVPVLEGISCAIKLVEAMLYLELENSKVCGYAQPRLK
jgi:allantoin racemase